MGALDTLFEMQQHNDLRLALPGLLRMVREVRRHGFGPGAIILKVLNRRAGALESGFIRLPEFKPEHRTFQHFAEKVGLLSPLLFMVMMDNPGLGWTCYVISAMVDRAEFPMGYCILWQDFVPYKREPAAREPTDLSTTAGEVFDEL